MCGCTVCCVVFVGACICMRGSLVYICVCVLVCELLSDVVCCSCVCMSFKMNVFCCEFWFLLYGCVCLYMCVCVCVCRLNVIVWFVCD